MKNNSRLQVINIVAYLATLFVNFLSQSASTLGISAFPYTVAELGESRALFFLPAGYVFAIWGIIYLGLGAYIIYQGQPSQRENSIIQRIGLWFALSSVGNIAWLVLFLNNLTAESTIAMLLILVSLLAIYLRLGIGVRHVSRAERWFVHMPFSIYLGWISVATVANIAAALYEAGNVTSFIGITADTWAVIMMIVATILALAMLLTRSDIAYALVVVWALVGIYSRPFNTPVYSVVASLNAGLVSTMALTLAIVVAIAVFIRLLINRRVTPVMAHSA